MPLPVLDIPQLNTVTRMCTHGRNGVRHSQQPVFYRINGGGWSLTSSVDADSPPPHLAYQRNWPTRSVSELSVSELNSVRQSLQSHSSFVLEPVSSTSPVLPRPPTRGGGCGGNGGGGDANGNDDDDELVRLRKKLAHAEKTIALQQKVIEQLCTLRIHVDVTTTPP
jgi:hypothetical protein